MQSDLKTLEHLLQLPLFDSGHCHNKATTDELNNFAQSQNIKEFGILLRIEVHTSVIKKMISLYKASLQIRNLIKTVLRDGNEIVNKMGVYPNIEDPVTIYQLNSVAEKYTNRFVLPVFPQGINGVIRRLLMVYLKFHPSVAGLILVVRKG